MMDAVEHRFVIALGLLLATAGCPVPRDEPWLYNRQLDVPAPPRGPALQVATERRPAFPPPSDDVAPACRGRSFDLRTMTDHDACRVDRPATPAPAGAIAIAARVREASVAPGGTADVRITMTNVTFRDVGVDLDLSCGVELTIASHAYDEKGDRADAVGCPYGPGCSRLVYRVVLPPGGEIFATDTYVAKVDRKDPSTCAPLPPADLAIGTYELRVHTPLVEPRVDAQHAGNTVTRHVKATLVVAR